MNDRYLFRGKRADNGEWVQGRLLSDDVIVPCGEEFEICGGYVECKNVKGFEVIPETVGQCTGLKDKNGKLIFEGDCISTDLTRPYNIVEFRNGSFMLNCNDGDKDYYDMMFPLFNQVLSNKELTVCQDLEVIGNYHDNPELSEVKNE